MRRIIVLAVVALLAAACDGYVAGGNGQGQLGLGDGVTGPGVVNVHSPWDSLVTGWFTTCGITRADTLWCWGDNAHGQTGNGTTGGDQFTPNQVDTNTDWQQVATGYRHTCGIRSGQMWCWGSDTLGSLGNGTTTTGSQGSPQRVGTDSDWDYVGVGYYTSCGIRNGGDLYCWGSNANGEVGDGTTTDRFTPVAVGAALAPWQSVDGGRNHTCAITTTGTAHCWGNNDHGQLGGGSPVVGFQSWPPYYLDATWENISAGEGFTCGIRTPEPGDEWWQTVGYCWGENDEQQIRAEGESYEVPQEFGFVMVGIDFVGYYVSSISAGRDHACAVTRGTFSGNVFFPELTVGDQEQGLVCQGSDEYDQWVSYDQFSNVPLSANLVEVSAGARHTVVTAWEP